MTRAFENTRRAHPVGNRVPQGTCQLFNFLNYEHRGVLRDIYMRWLYAQCSRLWKHLVVTWVDAVSRSHRKPGAQTQLL